jgi:hypothetical protein
MSSVYGAEDRDITSAKGRIKKVVGYIWVSTEMQATDGLSLDAQRAAIEQCCAS